MTWRPDWMQMEDLQQAVWAIEDFENSYSSNIARMGDSGATARDPVVLLHIFSNGGAHWAVQLAQAYRENIRPYLASSTASSKELPISALIFDSSPGHASVGTATRTTLSSLPKNAVLQRGLLTPVAYIFLGGCYIFHILGIAEHCVVKLWRELNHSKGPFVVKQNHSNHTQHERQVGQKPIETSGSDLKPIPRTYIFSEADDMIASEDVLDHAATARRQTGLSDNDAEEFVRVEEFTGSMHVNHVSVDPTRYWKIVQETVERGIA